MNEITKYFNKYTILLNQEDNESVNLINEKIITTKIYHQSHSFQFKAQIFQTTKRKIVSILFHNYINYPEPIHQMYHKNIIPIRGNNIKYINNEVRTKKSR